MKGPAVFVASSGNSVTFTRIESARRIVVHGTWVRTPTQADIQEADKYYRSMLSNREKWAGSAYIEDDARRENEADHFLETGELPKGDRCSEN